MFGRMTAAEKWLIVGVVTAAVVAGAVCKPPGFRADADPAPAAGRPGPRMDLAETADLLPGDPAEPPPIPPAADGPGPTEPNP
jgi:hypothetical protein